MNTPDHTHTRPAKLSADQKAFNSTADGQRAMAADALSRSTVALLNAKVRQLGGEAWADTAIRDASESALRMMRDDLLPIYNRLIVAVSEGAR